MNYRRDPDRILCALLRFLQILTGLFAIFCLLYGKIFLGIFNGLLALMYEKMIQRIRRENGNE